MNRSAVRIGCTSCMFQDRIRVHLSLRCLQQVQRIALVHAQSNDPPTQIVLTLLNLQMTGCCPDLDRCVQDRSSRVAQLANQLLLTHPVLLDRLNFSEPLPCYFGSSTQIHEHALQIHGWFTIRLLPVRVLT
jgi:hypothetical protein